MTKGMAAMLVYTTKECNYNSIVIAHQNGGYDVTCTPRIACHITVSWFIFPYQIMHELYYEYLFQNNYMA